ncbi:MAG: hypothetical protein LUH46_11435 [Alistipes sp.]|nr:hypothetical protein [Alistipes sp.]
MNFTSTQMQQTLRRLESTMTDITPEQRKLLDELNDQIEENGRHYVVESLTVEQMREHGYDVTEHDAGLIDRIAEKVEVDADMLWNGVAIWADTYGVKSLEEY